jgi:hypothetical protein
LQILLSNTILSYLSKDKPLARLKSVELPAIVLKGVTSRLAILAKTVILMVGWPIGEGEG